NKEGGVFSGPVTGNSFEPSKGPGTDPVVYTYTNSSTGCASSVTVPVTIHPSPIVSFSVADVCIDNATDTTRFVNNTTSSDPVTIWQWEFSGGGGVTISNLEAPGHLYTSDGLHQVKLTATTSNGCVFFSEKTIDLGLKPEADFYWLNECFHEGDSVRIFDNTLKGSPVTSRSWNFFDGNPPLTVLNPSYPKLSAGYIPAEYIVNTNYLNCSDTVRKDIFIRPTIELTSDDYFEDFEAGAGGWIADSGPDNIWALGTPDRPVIDNAASGITAWYTAYDIANQEVQSASLTSPCFDFSAGERPMISMKLWRRFDRNRDGAALQYKIGDSPEWEYLGTIGDGIEWFNSTLIKGRPGGEQTGWTTLATPDTAWTEARRRLDEINGKQDVKFRIAYGSDGTAEDNDGMAVDDIRIGARTRNVLLEHFTNNSSTTVVRANGIVNTVSSELVRDVININYHTNFPGPDLLYNDIPSDMSARVLYYGLSRVPYSLVDGGTTNEFSGIFDYLVADLDSNELNKRSLISPQFRIEINPVLSAGLLVTNARLTALDDLNEENVTLYMAVTAREITTVSSPNGEAMFTNTLRKMLPDAGGSNLPKIWTRGESYDSPDFTWKITNIYDSDDIEIIAFVQNNVTREIYQATASGINDVTVGVERVFGDDAAFSLYPNPSSGRLVISFGEPLVAVSELQILDQTGSLLRRYTAGPGQTMLEIDDHNLPNGVYIVRMMSGNLSGGMRKLVVSGR
ncbi:MAG: T9SS type A sorting domain-containing protein, partial [Bacteroidales bacterium]|nr:T9SS type A sorting domain-containing protein [Bacteroidales bacterium]